MYNAPTAKVQIFLMEGSNTFNCIFNIMAADDKTCPYSKVHVANMGPIWGRQDPGGPHVGPINIAICVG